MDMEIGEDFKDFEFYEKMMSSNLVDHAKSSLTELETKLSALAEDTCRRLRNTSRKLDRNIGRSL